jgi:hypothetical protein
VTPIITASIFFLAVCIVIQVEIETKIIHRFGVFLRFLKKNDEEKTRTAIYYSYAPFVIFLFLIVMWKQALYMINIWMFLILISTLSTLHRISLRRAFILCITLTFIFALPQSLLYLKMENLIEQSLLLRIKSF